MTLGCPTARALRLDERPETARWSTDVGGETPGLPLSDRRSSLVVGVLLLYNLSGAGPFRE